MSTCVMSACWSLQMPPSMKAVLISLADNANDHGYCWPSLTTIAKRTCLSRRTVIRAIAWLERAGLVRADRDDRTRTHYWVTPDRLQPVSGGHPCHGDTSATASTAGDTTTPPQCHGGTSLVSRWHPNRKEPSKHSNKATVMGGSAAPIPHADVAHNTAKHHSPANGESASPLDTLLALTCDAVAAYNAILGKPAGLLLAVHLVNDVRREQVRRVLPTARLICDRVFGTPEVIPEFWEQYFGQCAQDPWKRGDGPYTGAHASWRPDFEYLTRKAVMTAVFDQAMTGLEDAGDKACLPRDRAGGA